MKTDITVREDIARLMETFYQRAFSDELIGHYFTGVIPLNLETHLPVIVDFWETVLFGVAKYKRNAMQVHQHLHQLLPFQEAHFTRWVDLFRKTVDELFEGDMAENAKQRAASVATVMKLKTIYRDKGLHSII